MGGSIEDGSNPKQVAEIFVTLLRDSCDFDTCDFGSKWNNLQKVHFFDALRSALEISYGCFVQDSPEYLEQWVEGGFSFPRLSSVIGSNVDVVSTMSESEVFSGAAQSFFEIMKISLEAFWDDPLINHVMPSGSFDQALRYAVVLTECFFERESVGQLVLYV